MKPYVICHMLSSVDGKVTGDFLYGSETEEATELYYELNRSYGAEAYACGRVTMEGSFTGGWYPELEKYESTDRREDFISPERSGFYAVAFDTCGRLGWKKSKIEDDDPGYGGAQIIEVLTEQADGRYLSYLRETGVSYIFAGKEKIDIGIALEKLSGIFKIEKLLLEGGSIINGAFLLADAVDELSLVVAPVAAGSESRPLFGESKITRFKLKELKQYENGVLWLNYVR